MQVSYNGFTGELVKLERTIQPWSYELKFYDWEKNVYYSFSSVEPKDIQFPDIEKCGQWKEISNAPIYTCSACGGTIHCCSVREPEELPKYCSKCGAKMSGAVSFGG